MTRLDDVYDGLSGQIGTPPDQLKVISMLLAAIPLAAVMPYFPPKSNLIHVYSIILSYIFHTQVLHLNSGFQQLVGQSIGTWLAVKYCRATKKRKPWFWAIFIGNMAVLTVNHFARWAMNIPLDIIEITGSQMVLVMKLTLFAWNAYDGGRPLTELDRIQARDRLEEIPGLLPFLGYCFFFPSVLAGPNFPYQAYAAYVDRSLFATADKEGPHNLPRGRWRKATKRIAIASFYLAIYAVFGGKYSFVRLLEPASERHSFWYNLLFVEIAGFMCRTKYYAVWCFCEAGVIVSGLGWDPEVKKYNRGRNVEIRGIEFAQSFKTLLDAWNCGTNYWLRECVYKRLAKKGKKPGFKSTMATFTTSAFWHGINPTYYITFVLGGFLQGLGRKLRANLRPFTLPPDYQLLDGSKKAAAENTLIKRTYDVLSVIAVHLTLNFAIIPFIVLDLQPAMAVWKRLHYYGLFLTFLPLLAFRFGLQDYCRKALKRRAQAAGVTDQAVDKMRNEAKRQHEKGVNFAPDAAGAAENELDNLKKAK
ncbi:MBOAT-domain-containing protein [Cystobasidium minutum MCA 4210]|uniref:MBOAT-domain-containing protein n=1 Tax=Cystobasidium minutum MCA 4210 TaxID=1397322 RepID=UPI0034CF0186|eukprot:jgi/Rhomi1/194840/gm1.3054_g